VTNEADFPTLIVRIVKGKIREIWVNFEIFEDLKRELFEFSVKFVMDNHVEFFGIKGVFGD